MKYTVEESLSNFKFWSGGKDRADKCSIQELDSIEEFLEEIEPEDGWTDTAINDMFWFEFDTLAQHLGYNNEEDFDLQHDPNYLDDDQLEEFVEEWFADFLQGVKEKKELTVSFISMKIALGVIIWILLPLKNLKRLIMQKIILTG